MRIVTEGYIDMVAKTRRGETCDDMSKTGVWCKQGVEVYVATSSHATYKTMKPKLADVDTGEADTSRFELVPLPSGTPMCYFT